MTWQADLPCVLNFLRECIAIEEEACQCRRMPQLVYEEAYKAVERAKDEETP